MSGYLPVSEKFSGIFRAQVLDTSDPMSGGRVRVRVWPMMEDIDEEVLPWAAPAFSLFEGGESGHGAWTVPAVDSHVFVFFEGGDIFHPVYFASAPAKDHHPSDVSVEKKVWQSRSGHRIEVSDVSGSEEIKVTHKSGAEISMDSAGQILIKNSGESVMIGKGALRSLLLETAATVFNSHTHVYSPGPGGPIPTAAPDPQMLPGDQTVDLKAS